jgi:hypothetical protein
LEEEKHIYFNKRNGEIIGNYNPHHFNDAMINEENEEINRDSDGDEF